MVALILWQLLITLAAIKVCTTTNLDLELRLGPSHNQEEEVLTASKSGTNPTSEQQQVNPTTESIVGFKRKRKVHRTRIPLLKAKEQENKQLTEAQMQKQKRISEATSRRRLKRQHDRLMGKQSTEAEKQKHRENMKKYREKVIADPELAAEYRRRISAHKIARTEQAKNDPIEAAWQKKLKQDQNRAYREKKKLEKQKLKSQINHPHP